MIYYRAVILYFNQLEGFEAGFLSCPVSAFLPGLLHSLK